MARRTRCSSVQDGEPEGVEDMLRALLVLVIPILVDHPGRGNACARGPPAANSVTLPNGTLVNSDDADAKGVG